GPAPAARAANLALRQRLRVEIVLTPIDRRAGEPRDPRHNRETTPSRGSHLGSCGQSPAPLVELAADRVPAILDAALVDHPTRIRLFAEIRNPARPSHTDARPQSAIQLLFGMALGGGCLWRRDWLRRGDGIPQSLLLGVIERCLEDDSACSFDRLQDLVAGHFLDLYE